MERWSAQGQPGPECAMWARMPSSDPRVMSGVGQTAGLPASAPQYTVGVGLTGACVALPAGVDPRHLLPQSGDLRPAGAVSKPRGRRSEAGRQKQYERWLARRADGRSAPEAVASEAREHAEVAVPSAPKWRLTNAKLERPMGQHRQAD